VSVAAGFTINVLVFLLSVRAVFTCQLSQSLFKDQSNRAPPATPGAEADVHCQTLVPVVPV